ncbi:hypothetical protein ROHU_036717 [Labeo rohita]|uniref:Uncharacterized protein n=1 Tax=Labeo rohita TaxID=84645 RepID=A0A498MQZ5_LABRO|nr:hypothetical protein ROHU_036717 [Labeo rohita]
MFFSPRLFRAVRPVIHSDNPGKPSRSCSLAPSPRRFDASLPNNAPLALAHTHTRTHTRSRGVTALSMRAGAHGTIITEITTDVFLTHPNTGDLQRR